MLVHSENTLTRFYCSKCGKITEHYHRFFIVSEIHAVPLRKCKVCKLIQGTEVLQYMTEAQKQEWQDLHTGSLHDDEQHYKAGVYGS